MAHDHKQDDKDTKDQTLAPDGSPKGSAPGQSTATDWDMNRTKPGSDGGATPDDQPDRTGMSDSIAAGTPAGRTSGTR